MRICTSCPAIFFLAALAVACGDYVREGGTPQRGADQGTPAGDGGKGGGDAGGFVADGGVARADAGTDCAAVACPAIAPLCPRGQHAGAAPGQCCPTACVPDDCTNVDCPPLDCASNEIKWTAAGECCPTCVVVEEPPPPGCEPGDVLYAACPDGSQMPACKCDSEGWSCTDDPCPIPGPCAGVRCKAPDCGPEEHAALAPGECCGHCEPNACGGVQCPDIACAPGYGPAPVPGQCCPVCAAGTDAQQCEQGRAKFKNTIEHEQRFVVACTRDEDCVYFNPSTRCEGSCGAAINKKYLDEAGPYIEKLDAELCWACTAQPVGCPPVVLRPVCDAAAGECRLAP